MNMMDFFRMCIQSEDGKILYLLALIAITMIIDFITGTIGAWVNKDIEFRSKEGINGILRKIASMLTLLIFVPVSVLIPNDAGVALMYTLYIGYLAFELKSILENLNRCGIEVKAFERIIEALKGK